MEKHIAAYSKRFLKHSSLGAQQSKTSVFVNSTKLN